MGRVTAALAKDEVSYEDFLKDKEELTTTWGGKGYSVEVKFEE